MGKVRIELRAVKVADLVKNEVMGKPAGSGKGLQL